MLLVNKRNSRPFSYHQCFCVGLRIGLIREHFCVNWLNLEAIWRLPRRHMLRAPSHLSSGKARGDLRQSYPISRVDESFPYMHIEGAIGEQSLKLGNQAHATGTTRHLSVGKARGLGGIFANHIRFQNRSCIVHCTHGSHS